ncbi:MAG: shikimate kinase [Candidatus Omnitrophica bacterium]|nr:shikimate kinase [Candidatus Omnitrophota bacterium]
MSNIYLVGFMGTGKTSVGRELARRTKNKFIDLDDLIESREKRSIPDIFAKDGEPHFRKLEKETLLEVSKDKGLIVACGGGIVLDRQNIETMKKTGKVICLSASAQVILERTSRSTHRPLLNVASPKEKIETLLKARASCYALADETIDTSGFSVKQVADSIIKILPD